MEQPFLTQILEDRGWRTAGGSAYEKGADPVQLVQELRQLLLSLVRDGPYLTALDHTLAAQAKEFTLNDSRYMTDSDLPTLDQRNIILRE